MLKKLNFLAALGVAAILSVSALAADPGFSLHNKSKTKIVAKVLNGDSMTEKELKADDFFDRPIDTKKTTMLIIIDTNGNPIYYASFRKDKTIYINWDNTHQPKIYPQKGPFLGLTGRTFKGYNNKNNIAPSEIAPAF